jgi:hypothetical protein
MMSERKALLSWLALNKTILTKYDAHEVARLALQNQFDVALVYDEVPHWANDRDARNTLSIRTQWSVDRELNYINRLHDSWVALGRRLTQGKDFDD